MRAGNADRALFIDDCCEKVLAPDDLDLGHQFIAQHFTKCVQIELAARSEFKHVIVNDDLDKAVAELERLAARIVEPPKSKGAPEK